MHRSGTSAMTRVLNLLGCALPEDLVGAGDGNELGHWESVAANSLNEEILMSAGSSWQDWGPINDDWRHSGLRNEMLGRVTKLVADHAALGPLFAVKDPRLCRLADLWLDSMDASNVEPLTILMLRNPIEVVASLESRDLMVPGYGQLLWLRYVLDAEYFSRGRRRVVCRYDQLLRNWYGVMEHIKTGLAVSLPRNSLAVHAEIDAFLTSQQRHHEASVEEIRGNSGMSLWLRRSFAILLQWSELGENKADHDELDQIRHEFDRAYGAFARLLLPTEISGGAGSGSGLKRALLAQLSDAQHATEAATATMRQAETQQAAAVAREAELKAQLDLGAAQAQQLRAEIDNLRAEAGRLAESAIEVEALRAREAELQSQIDAGVTLTHDLQTEIEALRAEAGRLAETAAKAETLMVHEAQLITDLENHRAALTETQLTAEREHQERLAAERQLADTLVSQHKRGLQVAELEGRLAATESALLQRQEELAQYLDRLLTAEKTASIAQTAASLERELRLDGERRLTASDHIMDSLRSQLSEARLASPPPPDHLFTELAQLTGMLQEQEAATLAVTNAKAEAEQLLVQRAGEIEHLLASLQQREEVIRSSETNRISIEQKLAARFDEVARLTNLLESQSGRASAADTNSRWLADLIQLTQSFPKWWALMPQEWRRRREHFRYRRAGLFNADSYLAMYPDVAVNGMDPVRHYIVHGMSEGRQRS